MATVRSTNSPRGCSEAPSIEFPLRNTRYCNKRRFDPLHALARSEEHTSELQSLMRISYAVFCLQKKHTSNCQSVSFLFLHTSNYTPSHIYLDFVLFLLL